MFHQLLTPVGDSLPLSFLVAVAADRRRAGDAGRAAPAGLAGVARRLIVGLVIAVAVWQMPVGLALTAPPPARCSRCGR